MRGRTAGDGAVPRWTRADWWGVVLEAPDAQALASFYSALLGWEIAEDGPDGAAVAPPDGVAYLAFQTVPRYIPPRWPPEPGAQRITMHLDFQVDDLAVAVGHALELGAREASHQPQANVRVLLDPAGHPFCLYLDEREVP